MTQQQKDADQKFSEVRISFASECAGNCVAERIRLWLKWQEMHL
jgi:hypothetical protein